MIINNKRYIYYRDVLDYIKIILGKIKLNNKRKQLIEDNYKEVLKIYNEDLERTRSNEADEVKAIYKAEIFEYESGRTDILYECDKENNDECSKESCTSYNQCNHTSNIKYAKNYINEKYNN